MIWFSSREGKAKEEGEKPLHVYITSFWYIWFCESKAYKEWSKQEKMDNIACREHVIIVFLIRWSN